MGCDFTRNRTNENIPDNIFACPKCGEIDPEILNINVDNKKIGFYCKNCAENEYKSKNFTKEENLNNKTYYLKANDTNEENQYWFKEYNNHEGQENKKSFLKKIFQRKLENAKKIIKKKNEQLEKIIKFNNMVKVTSEKYKNNYFHLKSLNNISDSLQREIFRDSNDLKFLLAAFNNEIEFSNKAIPIFEENAKIKIERDKESLFLSKKNLKDIDIMTLSMIKFNQLKEIDLSENEIIEIEPICNMNLPFLEFLNLSYNNIKNIEPLGELNSKKLKYLFLQNNQIEDIKILNDWNFPKLRILRLENNNNIQENPDSFKEIVDKYKKNKLIIVTKTKIDEIKSQYHITYDENTKILELEGEANENEKKEELDKKEEDEEDEEDELILKNLFIIISQKSENSITKLKVNNFKIKNPSILKRIQFDQLDELNLSNNNIKDLQFLKGIKAVHLKRLYLDNNKINDLSLVDKISDLFPHLEEITLSDNIFNLEESQKTNLKENLDNNNIKLQI